MDEIETVVADLAKISGVMEVAAADDTGTFLAGANNDKPEEFAATLTFVSRAGNNIGDIIGAESVAYIRITGKKYRLFIAVLEDYTIGVRIAVDAVEGLVHKKVKKVIAEFSYALEEA